MGKFGRPKLSEFRFRLLVFVFAFTYGRNHKKSEEMRRRRERRREDRLAPAQSQAFDLAIIGGGINGCGIARDAAGRGASVILFERDDLASGTSSRSTKLIHGGLRYLEHYEFRLVREALLEREVLLARSRRTSCGRCASCCPTMSACGRNGSCALAFSSTTISAARKRLPATTVLNLTRDPPAIPLEADFQARLRIFRLLGRRFAPRRPQRPRCGRPRRRDQARARASSMHPASTVSGT